MRIIAVVIAVLALAGCVRIVPDARPPVSAPRPAPTPAPTSTPVAPMVAAGPSVASLGIGAEDARSALASFIESCPRLVGRTDASTLTTGTDWRAVCDTARAWPASDAVRFFTTEFETARLGDGKTFVTGYFEPEILASRTRRVGYDQPIYGMPRDLVRDPNWTGDGRAPLGKVTPEGFVPYDTRAEIMAGSLLPPGTPLVFEPGAPEMVNGGRAPVLAWAADPAEFFFLQVQGSGLLRLPDGSVMRIGYAGQNGRGYVGIGALMRTRGLIGEGPGQYPGSMQGILRYIRENPEAGRALMNENPSWVFFQENRGDGPLGSLNVPVRAGSSVATDPLHIPLGAPVWLDVDRSEVDGLWIAQDTGGAIKGPNRFDTFWGNGPEARVIAGGMSARGEALLLLPRGVLARLLAR
ncbi:murein transglycosylase A [Qipengyuania sediminis]|uniref:murein transglycosylase A n=1 Tax=Qipengyuania sediminis TaxID=1532023 RepID=UPI00105929AA|nr:murein transglycosylase A [Qipengyuania sediminis]